MKKLKTKILFILLMSAFFVACGGSADDVETKKTLLQEKRRELEKLNAEISQLEKEIAAKDPSFQSNKERITLVSIKPISRTSFTHFVEVKGKVVADNNVILTAETMGVVRTVNVSEGQGVGQGQVVVQQDNKVIQRTIEEVKTSLELANTLYEKQTKLWEQKIGTEIQYLEARNRKQMLESQLQTLYAQLDLSNVRAPFSGVVDEVFIKRGENAGPSTPLMRIVNLGNIKVEASVSESYLTKVKVGDPVVVEFPSLDIEEEARITMIGQIINPDNRTFRIEISVPNRSGKLKPDMLATVKLKDYQEENVVVVPTNLIQRDKAGDFVFVAIKKGKGFIAKKVKIKRGQSYQDKTLVTSGLEGGEQIIEEGFKEVVEGAKIEIVKG